MLEAPAPIPGAWLSAPFLEEQVFFYSGGLGDWLCVADSMLQDEGYGLCVAHDMLQDDRNMLKQESLTAGGEHLGKCWGNLGAIFG